MSSNQYVWDIRKIHRLMNYSSHSRLFFVELFEFRQLSSQLCYYEPRVSVVIKPCQGCMRVHVYVGFVMGRL